MAAIDIVNRVFRNFYRYTGDGLPGAPVNAPLPIGDPQSGVNNPNKAEIRVAFGAVLEGGAAGAQEVIDANLPLIEAAVENASTSAENATAEADRAQAIADGIAPGAVPDNAVTRPKIAPAVRGSIAVSVTEFGAVGDGVDTGGGVYTGTDNTAAINAAIASGLPVVFPAGVFLTQGGHRGNFATIRGAGLIQTRIVCTASNDTVPVFRLGAISRLADMTIGFNGNISIAVAVRGKRVGLWCGNGPGYQFCKGASVENVSFSRVGTGLYDSNEGESATFSARFIGIDVREFSWAIVDFTSNFRTQNTFISVHGGATTGRNTATYGFNFEGANDTGMTLIDINIESTISTSGLRFINCRGVQLVSAHAEDWVANGTDRAFLVQDKSSIHIGRLDFWYSVLKANCTILGLYSAQRLENTGNAQFTNDTLHIDHLDLNGLYSDEARTARVTLSSGVSVLRRYVDEATGGALYVEVDSYSWYSFFAADESWYGNPPRDQDNFCRIRKFGQQYAGRSLDRVYQRSASFTCGRHETVNIVSASGGNVVITLPKTTPGASREYVFTRVDGTASTVTFAAQSGDASYVTAIPANATRRVISDGFAGWVNSN